MNVENEHQEWTTMKASWQSTTVAEFMMTQQLRLGLKMRMVASWMWLGRPSWPRSKLMQAQVMSCSPVILGAPGYHVHELTPSLSSTRQHALP